MQPGINHFSPKNCYPGIFCLLLFFQVGLASCSTEKQIAARIRPKVAERAILLMNTDILFKKNLNTDSIQGFKKMTSEVQDSALFASSHFIKNINDTMLLNRYSDQLKNELKQLGFKVFVETEIDSFFRQQCPAFILNLAQSEVEEYLFPVTENEVYDDSLMYRKRVVLHGVNLNNWFEMSVVNKDEALKVFFSSHSAKDFMKGGFQRHPLTLEVVYRYTVRNINDDDVLGLAEFSGKKDAGYVFDFFLNQDLLKALPANTKIKTYWHYDRLKNKLKPAGEWRFNLLEDQVN